MTEAVSSTAARMTLPRWIDARVGVGLLLVLVSVAAGARIVASAGHLTPVFVAAHELVPGEQLTAADLSIARVRLESGGSHYVAASAAPPIGYVVNRVIGAHELVPAAALSPSAATADTRMVTVPVQPGHLPADLGRGDLVDVYVTPRAASGRAVPEPTLVLPQAAVDSREGGSRSFSGQSTLAVVLVVDASDVSSMVHAVESGVIDLVRVPPAAAGSRS
ncbi:MAG TPA: SAF domain-containing protein [Mycobacteriales bacterium]|nr:SAF domain-containing protein [Mycobacteriales bacterium]